MPQLSQESDSYSESAVSSVPPPITSVEHRGIETIPDDERASRPIDLFRVIFGTSNTFAQVVIGSFPILVFGLSFEQGLLATAIGLVVGATILMPMALFGPITGTNGAVSSGAHFGILGRLVGSLLAILTAITFYTLSVYITGDMVVFGMDELLGTGRPKWLLVSAYLLMAFAVLIISLYGYRLMMAVNRLNVFTGCLLYALGAVAIGGSFSYESGGSGLSGNSLTAAFIAAVLLIAANPVSMGAFLGDWSRYIPATAPQGRLLGAAFLGQLATSVPFIFGLASAAAITSEAPTFAAEGDYVGGLVSIAPTWFLVPLCLLTVVGGLAGGSTSVYGPGLDLSAMIVRFSRFQATVIIGLAATGMVLLGAFVLGFVQLISTLAAVILVGTSPWVVIMTIGFIVRRGWYSCDDLQVFNNGRRGGIYWYTKGLNWRALAAWLPGSAVGLLFVNLPGQFEGPLRDLVPNLGLAAVSGVDLGLVVAVSLSALLFVLWLLLFPEPRAVYGPAGPRWVRCSNSPSTSVAPIAEE